MVRKTTKGVLKMCTYFLLEVDMGEISNRVSAYQRGHTRLYHRSIM